MKCHRSFLANDQIQSHKDKTKIEIIANVAKFGTGGRSRLHINFNMILYFHPSYYIAHLNMQSMCLTDDANAFVIVSWHQLAYDGFNFAPDICMTLCCDPCWLWLVVWHAQFQRLASVSFCFENQFKVLTHAQKKTNASCVYRLVIVLDKTFVFVQFKVAGGFLKFLIMFDTYFWIWTFFTV